MKIKSIYINGLHNAVNKTYTFEDITYIFGNNGAGKSTILQAIQFALLGYIPGTAKNSREALLRHSPIGKIQVQLTLSEGITITRTITSAGSRVEVVPDTFDISEIIKDIEIPIFNFNDFMGQTANKLKEYFIKNILPTSDGQVDWKQVLTESIIDCNFQDRDAIINYGLSIVENLPGDEVLEQVIVANAKFKEEQSFNKSEQQRLQNTIDSLIYYDDYVGPTDLNELNSRLLTLNSLRDQVIRYDSAMQATKSTQDELAKLQEKLQQLGGKTGYETLQEKLETLKAQYKDLSSEVSTKQAEMASIRTKDLEASSIIKSNGICPYTKDACKTMVTKIEDLRNETVKYKAAIVTLTEDIDKKNKDLNDLNLGIRKCESAINEFLQIWNRIETLQKVTSDLPAKPTDKTVFDLNTEIDELNRSKSKLEANIRYNETIDNITKSKYESELQGKALACWVKKTDTNGLQTTLMLEPFNGLAQTMTSYIQQMYGTDTIKAHFNISSKANSFSFGLIRDNVYIPYDLLSSGEKCLYSLALMICISNSSKSPLKVMLCDDMFDHLDSQAIESTFATLKNIKDIQFIFAGVKECENAKDITIHP